MPLLISALRPIPRALLRELKSLELRGVRSREAAKRVLSVLVAVAAATFLDLDDLSWAAFSGYMVMRGSAAETFLRGLMRIAGTAGGALLGLVLAPNAAGDPLLLMIFLFFVSWIGTFQSLTTSYSYAWLFFGLTSGMVITEALASPDLVVHFAATRVAEITVGTCAGLVVASLFSETPGRTQQPAYGMRWCGRPRDALDQDWLREHWPLFEHSTRAALAVALLPIVWRWFSIEDFSQTAITSYVVMIVPGAAVGEHRYATIYERIAHRTLGCLLGSGAALVSIGFFGTGLPVTILTLAAGVWVGHHIQTGQQISYLGVQFTLGLLITLVQGPAPITDITPGLERLLGIAIGSAMLCLMILVWPLTEDKGPDATSP
ncbi:putative membrane protein YccC [Bradyrhizobium japonicum]|uniref:Membrane protein YccC n=1 Tax=Bradyrhizobium japonicum TaxID=375 RepID=A0ABV2RHI4_BRAJP|nr:FUSC family protein [Bradyrhizobium japonicum]UQD99834.1 FUSC family protein [Bradyrhizobium japonicum]WLB19853.1 FUSC family protein [Bradyrhizobium japonicum]